MDIRKWLWHGRWMVLLFPLWAACDKPAAAQWYKTTPDLKVIDRRILGKVHDYTANHGRDNRIWSRSLFQRRDLYVYLPPSFDRRKQYPVMFWFHGFAEDEQSFLRNIVPLIDDAIIRGIIPPIIAVAPDGTFEGEPKPLSPGSFFINSRAGDFEDYVLHDVWDFVCHHYPIRSERRAHVLAGASMGGFTAYNFGIRHRKAFGVVVGIFPPLNLRWVDKSGRYLSNFDPCDWGWRMKLKRHQPIARFFGGAVTLRLHHLTDPLYGREDYALNDIALNNPIELIDRTGLRPCELEMYVGYGGRDEFNIDAQVESFLYLAKSRGIYVETQYIPRGRHNADTAKLLFPGIAQWLGEKLAPFREEILPVGACIPNDAMATELPVFND